MANNTKQQDRFGGTTAVAEQAKETGAQMLEKAKEAGASVTQRAGEAASFVGKKANEATAAVGGGMQSLGAAIREKGPHSGVLGGAASAVGSTLESGGRYLHEQGLRGIGEDLTNLIRRNPLPAILLGIAAGYLIARATSSRS